MRGKAYLANLLAVVVFPVLWYRAWAFAKRQDADPKAKAKVAVAIVASIAIFAGGLGALETFKQSNIDGFYEQLDQRIKNTVGESDYQGAVELSIVIERNIANADQKIAEAQAAGDETAEQTWRDAKAGLEEDLAEQEAIRDGLSGNHRLYVSVAAELQGRDDAGARTLLDASPLLDDDADASIDRAFEIKADMMSDMGANFNFLLYPSLFGAFFAPIVFAMGSILAQSFEESETVGFKPYPHKSMGWFLLLGGMGVPSPFFAAWAVTDMRGRQDEGQIAL